MPHKLDFFGCNNDYNGCIKRPQEIEMNKPARVTETHHAPEFKHVDSMEWEMGRFKNKTKFLFHPRPERPTEPNAGFLKYAPGASFPLHRHDFAQVWYIIEGEFSFAGKRYGPGTVAFMPDPHFEHEMHTASGG